MIDLAIRYKDKIQEIYQKLVAENPDFIFYWNYGEDIDYTIPIDDNEWNKIQRVSINKEGTLLGFLSATVYRRAYSITNMSFISFYPKSTNFILLKDMRSFVKYLLKERKFVKIQFNCIIGNHAERFYDKFIESYSTGRIVGIQKLDVKLADGKLYDLKIYEIVNPYII